MVGSEWRVVIGAWWVAGWCWLVRRGQWAVVWCLVGGRWWTVCGRQWVGVRCVFSW